MKSPAAVVLHTLLSLSTLIGHTHAQNVTVPSTCTSGFTAGTDTVIATIPYTYAQVLSIIGSYKNLTWSGNPDNTVTLNGSDNTPGTARSYNLNGLSIIETLIIYDSPPNGPYYEVHSLAQLTAGPSLSNVTLYAPYDGTNVTSVCNGRASQFNFTANFCATNVTAAALAFHGAHSADAMGAAALLGGMNFTSCEALGVSNYTGAADGGLVEQGRRKWEVVTVVAMAVGGFVLGLM